MARIKHPTVKRIVRGAPTWLALAGGIAVLGSLALWWSVSRPELPKSIVVDEVRPNEAAGFNVLLISLDTVRKDRLGCYGYALARTPHLDSLAAHGALYTQAVTSAPVTLPAHATLLTGLYPPAHGVRDNGRHTLPAERETLAEVLGTNGYDTAAFLGCFVLDERFGLAQGFDVYDFEVRASGHRPEMPDFNERAANEVTDAALAWLAARGTSEGTAPFFVWAHYFDAHLPYRSPLATDPKLAGRPYDAEVAFVDRELGRLLDGLRESNVLSRTLIAVVSDHGEALGEHDEPTHGLFLYESTIAVPLLFSCPSIWSGPNRFEDRVTGLVDVVPTILDLLGVAPPASLDGESLLATRADPERAIYLETHVPLYLGGWSPLYGLRTLTQKYILAPRRELYDLTRDPNEEKNLFPSNPRGLARLEESLSKILEAGDASVEATRTVSDEEIERLRSLGYVESGQGTPDAGTRADPKDMVGIYVKALEAERLYAARRYAEAAAAAREALESAESLDQAVRVLAFSYLQLNRSEEAVELLRSSVRRSPDPFLVRSLAQMLIVREEYAEAMKVLELYAEIDPRDGRVPLLRGDCLLAQKKVREAIEQFETARRLDANRVGIQAQERIDQAKAQASSSR